MGCEHDYFPPHPPECKVGSLRANYALKCPVDASKAFRTDADALQQLAECRVAIWQDDTTEPFELRAISPRQNPLDWIFTAFDTREKEL